MSQEEAVSISFWFSADCRGFVLFFCLLGGISWGELPAGLLFAVMGRCHFSSGALKHCSLGLLLFMLLGFVFFFGA